MIYWKHNIGMEREKRVSGELLTRGSEVPSGSNEGRGVKRVYVSLRERWIFICRMRYPLDREGKGKKCGTREKPRIKI